MASQGRANNHPSQTIKKNWRWGITNKFILWVYHNADKNQTDIAKKVKLQANTSDEYRCKNPQQNIGKPNSTIYKKDHISWSSGIYYRDARMLQYPEISQFYIPHWQIKE